MEFGASKYDLVTLLRQLGVWYGDPLKSLRDPYWIHLPAIGNQETHPFKAKRRVAGCLL